MKYGDKMSNEEPEDETQYYPHTLIDDMGNRYEIVDTLCFKFMEMGVQINGPDAVITEPGIGSMELPVGCRIQALKTREGEFIVALRDDIYHPIPMVTTTKNPNYIYVRFADAISYYKELGYKDFASISKLKKALETDRSLKKLRYTTWWKDERKKRKILN